MLETVTRRVNEANFSKGRWAIPDFCYGIDPPSTRLLSTAAPEIVQPQPTGENSLTVVFEWKSELGPWYWAKDTVKKGNIRNLIILPNENTYFEDWHFSAEIAQIFTQQIYEEVSNLCKAFCESQGLIEVFEQCCAQAKTIFSNIQSIDCDIDYFEDDESEEMPHVVIRLQVDTDQEAVFTEYDKWLDWFVENVDDDKRGQITLLFQRV